MFDYCMEELEIHYEALLRARARREKTSALMIRAAVNADKKGFKGYIKSLEKLWCEIELAAGRSISTPEGFFGGLSKVGKRSKPKGR